MTGTPLQFLVPLDQPPLLITTSVETRPSRHREMFFHVAYWGLDFYHNAGTIDFLDLGKSVSFRPGDIGISPPNHQLRVVDVEDRDEVYFGFSVQGPADRGVFIPAVINVGEKFDALQAMALDAVRSWPIAPARSRALLWAILWEIARSHELEYPPRGALPENVRKAVEIIETELSTPLSVSGLARGLTLSPATLSRLFHRHMGTTMVAYIRRRRIERARFLLRETEMPIKEIAGRVGIRTSTCSTRPFGWRQANRLGPSAPAVAQSEPSGPTRGSGKAPQKPTSKIKRRPFHAARLPSYTLAGRKPMRSADIPILRRLRFAYPDTVRRAMRFEHHLRPCYYTEDIETWSTPWDHGYYSYLFEAGTASSARRRAECVPRSRWAVWALEPSSFARMEVCVIGPCSTTPRRAGAARSSSRRRSSP